MWYGGSGRRDERGVGRHRAEPGGLGSLVAGRDLFERRRIWVRRGWVGLASGRSYYHLALGLGGELWDWRFAGLYLALGNGY